MRDSPNGEAIHDDFIKRILCKNELMIKGNNKTMELCFPSAFQYSYPKSSISQGIKKKLNEEIAVTDRRHLIMKQGIYIPKHQTGSRSVFNLKHYHSNKKCSFEIPTSFTTSSTGQERKPSASKVRYQQKENSNKKTQKQNPNATRKIFDKITLNLFFPQYNNSEYKMTKRRHL